MKKELFAGVLLLVLIGLCAWNLRYLSRMCTQLDEAAAQAEASCPAGDPARASGLQGIVRRSRGRKYP